MADGLTGAQAAEAVGGVSTSIAGRRTPSPRADDRSEARLWGVPRGGLTAKIHVLAWTRQGEGAVSARFLKLANGVSGYDTFSRLFRMPDPEQFRAAIRCFMPASPSHAKGLWRSTARFCAARSTAQAASRRCTWCPGGATSNRRRGRSPPTRSQTKSPPYRSY
jgi:hypothetical protein